MSSDTIATLMAGIFGGGILKTVLDKSLDWWRFKNKDNAETQKLIHDSQAQTLTITSTLLSQWIQTASMAESKLAEKDADLRETQHALGLCKESMERCKRLHGCWEG